MTLLQHSTLVRGDTARGMQLADLAYTLQLQSASDDKLEGVSVLVEKEKNIVSFGILSADPCCKCWTCQIRLPHSFKSLSAVWLTQLVLVTPQTNKKTSAWMLRHVEPLQCPIGALCLWLLYFHQQFLSAVDWEDHASW